MPNERICNITNDFPADKLLCCSDSDCKLAPPSLICSSGEIMANCHNISTYEPCQKRTDDQAQKSCQYKNDLNKVYCLTIDLTNPLGANSELKRFEEGAEDAGIHRRQRAWILERKMMEESFDYTIFTICCDSKECLISKNKDFSNCTYIANVYQSLGISCPDVFKPLYEPNGEVGWPCLIADRSSLGFFDISFDGQICDKIIKNSPGSSLGTSDKIALGTGIGLGVPGLALTAFGSWLAWKQYKRKEERKRTNQTELNVLGEGTSRTITEEAINSEIAQEQYENQIQIPPK